MLLDAARSRSADALSTRSAESLLLLPPSPAPAASTPPPRLHTLLDRARYGVGTADLQPRSAPNLHVLVKQAQLVKEMPKPDEDALWRAASRGDVATVRQLLARGGAQHLEYRCVRYGGSTAFHQACRNGHSEVAKLLSGAGADLEARNDAGLTPLAAAATMGHKALVAELLLLGGAQTPTRPAARPMLSFADIRERDASFVLNSRSRACAVCL